MGYTIFASLPFLLFILIIALNIINYIPQLHYIMYLNFSFRYYFIVIIVLAFLVKLGGYGLFRISIIFFNFYIYIFCISISLTRAAIIGVLCVQHIDIKVIIAYSSIAHIGIVITSLLYGRSLRTLGGIGIIIRHGISSSRIFFGRNIFYLRSISRSLLINKGFLGAFPLTSFF